MSYDTYLAQKTEEYLSPCEHYKCEIAIDEYCKSCNHYCEEFLELQDNDWIIVQAMNEIELRDDKSFLFSEKKLEALKNESKRRHHGKYSEVA